MSEKANNWKEEVKQRMKSYNYTIMVLAHPVSPKSLHEVLFSLDGERFSNVISQGPSQLRDEGINAITSFTCNAPTFFRIMALAIEEKAKSYNYGARSYEMSAMRLLARSILNVENRFDIEIPEIVRQIAEVAV